MKSLAIVLICLAIGLVTAKGISQKSKNVRGNRLVTSCNINDMYVPENGKRALADTKVGSTAKFDCMSGYVLVGLAISTCLPSGKWSSKSPWCRPICEYTDCPSGTQCHFNYKKDEPICKCNTAYDCPLEYEPVCGSDGQTYSSKCIMMATSCAGSKSIDVVSKGPCLTEVANGTCPMCPKAKRCPAFYSSTFALTGKVIKMVPDTQMSFINLFVQVDEVHKGYKFFKPGNKSLIKVQVRQERCSCVPAIPLGRALIMGQTITTGPDFVDVPVIDELSFVEKYYSSKQLSLCWLY